MNKTISSPIGQGVMILWVAISVEFMSVLLRNSVTFRLKMKYVSIFYIIILIQFYLDILLVRSLPFHLTLTFPFYFLMLQVEWRKALAFTTFPPAVCKDNNSHWIIHSEPFRNGQQQKSDIKLHMRTKLVFVLQPSSKIRRCQNTIF